MRLMVYFLIVACMLSGTGVLAQTVTLSLKNAPIKKAFTKIKGQTSYYFVYIEDIINKAQPVTIEVTNAPLVKALDQLFAGQSQLTYEIQDHMIVVKYRQGTAPLLVTISGTVVNTEAEPVEAATVMVRGNPAHSTATNSKGQFVLNNVEDDNVTIVISSIGYQTTTVKPLHNNGLLIKLSVQASELEDVKVASTGYQLIPKERETGSFVKVNSELLNRRVSTNILDRLDGITSGLLFHKNNTGATNQSAISIRGRSTLFANPQPLIIVDNFPYDGDINNINPNDVAGITILKDAAAASIWGAFSGNGVIVITTKKGGYRQPVKVSFNTNITVTEKPDLYYLPELGSSAFIDMEQFLYNKGYYDSYLPFSVVSPVVEILNRWKNGSLTEAAAQQQINELRNKDVRQEKEKYFYRKGVNQQYAISLNGGGDNIKYYFSAGYDKNLHNLAGNQHDRITLNANNTYQLAKDKLEMTTGFIFSQRTMISNNTGNAGTKYPYIQLADENGNPLVTVNGLRQSYKDTAGGGKLNDWNYRPLEELQLADNTSRLTDYRLTLSLKYKIFKKLSAGIHYQFSKGIFEQEDYKSEETYYTRNLINTFSQIDEQTGYIKKPVPQGGILDNYHYSYTSHNIRTQVNYSEEWNQQHTITALAGAELRQVKTERLSNRLYGYGKGSQSGRSVDYTTSFPLFYAPYQKSRIPENAYSLNTTDIFISYFTNAAYTYRKRYVLSVSARKDESNLFGVKANQKGVPLMSVGAAWDISRENFYRVNWLPLLKLRVTNGYNGNIDKTISAFTTARIGFNLNPFNAPQGFIVNPPNDSLRWEKIHMTNIGLDFAFRNNRLSGSIEYYFKKGTDLIGYSPIDPTTGVTQFKGNTADIRGQGFDITLNAKIIDRKFRWHSQALLSHTIDKVTKYKVKQSMISSYTNQNTFNPLEGNPLYSIYSYRWAGLDHEGNPLGYIDGAPATEYTAIINSSDFSNLVYNGPATPVYFGSLRNTFRWKDFDLSFNITFKLGYYFRRSSVNYSDFLKGTSGHIDYAQRWRKPGDERFTNVPAFQYPVNPERESFYTYSEVLVEKGDHFRLQDVQFSYTLNAPKIGNLSLQSFRIYLYANNLGILWKATGTSLDPDYVINNLPEPKTFSAGFRIDF